ncbi:MAG: polyprenyl synthetase family protein, partial [Ignavibacteriaceae bacterium]|nr:polyprenyl synthetase family protein [Ignavibacteriaceae bacterium]
GVVSNAVKRMSEGELLQIQKTRKLDIDEETYFKVISDKTASLLETCCVIGAMSATDNPVHHEALRKFGHSIGISFQIRDDILDYEGTASLTGKPVGGDIKEKKITLPLIYSLRQVSERKAAEIRKLLKNGKNKDKVKHIVEFVRENNGIDYALQTAQRYSLEAKESLKIFPDTPAKIALESLVDFITERKN